MKPLKFSIRTLIIPTAVDNSHNVLHLQLTNILLYVRVVFSILWLNIVPYLFVSIINHTLVDNMRTSMLCLFQFAFTIFDFIQKQTKATQSESNICVCVQMFERLYIWNIMYIVSQIAVVSFSHLLFFRHFIPMKFSPQKDFSVRKNRESSCPERCDFPS